MLEVSVVIPLYNAEQDIERAIRSVLAQTVSDFELIIVDDGSTDNSTKVVEAINDPRIKLIRKENAGQGSARNTGIRASSGDLITFLDADDEWDESFLAAILVLYRRFPQAGLFATGYRRLYKDGFTVEISAAREKVYDSHVLVNDYFVRARADSMIVCINVAIHCKIFQHVGTFVEAEGVSTDRDMWARIALRYPLAFDTRVLATYHCEDTSNRASHRSWRIPPPPAFANTVKHLAETRQLPLEQCADVREYVKFLWIGSLDKALRVGNKKEAIMILRENFADSKVYKMLFWRLRILLALLPVEWVRLIRRFETSRWWSVRIRGRFWKSQPGISRRWYRQRCSPR